MKILIVILAITLSGCAVMQDERTFAACRAADLVTTKVALGAGATEANPIAHALMSFHWIPLIAVNVALIWLVHSLWSDMNDDERTLVNAVSCAPPLWNATVIAR